MYIRMQTEVGVGFFLANKGNMASFTANARWQPI